MSMHLSSKAFENGQRIPTRYTEDGKDISPPLSWSGLPPETRELALIVEDPDAPQAEPFVHWVIYKIPADATGLLEGIPSQTILETPAGALQGKNSFNRVGYGGPAPPRGHGTHHYYFRLYALGRPLEEVKGGLDKGALRSAMADEILAEAELMGTYER